MRSINRQLKLTIHWLLFCLLWTSLPLMALESDRQKPLEVNANSTDGTLGDGITTLRGNVDIRQGTLHLTANEAEVKKVAGRVNSVTFRGNPAFLEQDIEEQGVVHATANTIEYQVASGLVTLTGNADVKHPQYQISGELLIYDLNIQHFKGSSDQNGNGRIHIRLAPEVINNGKQNKDDKNAADVTATEPGSGVMSEIDSGVVSEMDSGVVSEMDSGVVSEMDSGVVSEMDSGVVSEIDSGVVSEIDSGVVSEIDSGVVSEIDSGVVSEIDSGVVSEIDSGVVSEIDSGVASEMDSGLVPEPESDQGSNLKPKLEPEPEPQKQASETDNSGEDDN